MTVVKSHETSLKEIEEEQRRWPDDISDKAVTLCTAEGLIIKRASNVRNSAQLPEPQAAAIRTCTGHGNTWWGSAGNPHFSSRWSHSPSAGTEAQGTGRLLKWHDRVFRGHVTNSLWRRSPRTSAAGRGDALSPFPLRSRHRWTQSGSFRAAWHVPSSPSQSLPCHCHSNA